MTKSEKQELKQRIEQNLEKLAGEIKELKALTRPISPENAIGRVSRMDAINNKTINEAALRKAVDKEKRLRIALNKIDDPDFGKCTNCGQDIRQGRMLLMPESNLCVRCAARM